MKFPFQTNLFKCHAAFSRSLFFVELPSLKRYKSRKVKKEQSEFFSFDLQPQHIDPDAIVSANLRLYQEQIAGTPHGGRQQASGLFTGN